VRRKRDRARYVCDVNMPLIVRIIH
jgi:hypothetical protein